MPPRRARTEPQAVVPIEIPADIGNRTVAEKLALVLEHIGRIPKSGHNDFHNYDYVTESDLVDAVRPLMAKVGLVLVPSVTEHVFEPGVAKTRGGELSRTYIEVEYLLTDGKGEIRFMIPGQAFDNADKGLYKAMTGSMKYALMKLCQVSTGDDPERNSKADRAQPISIDSSGRRAARGGHEEMVTPYQLARISGVMREAALPRSLLVGAMSQYLGDLELPEEEDEQSPFIRDQLIRLTSEQAGELIRYLEGVANIVGEDAAPDS